MPPKKAAAAVAGGDAGGSDDPDNIILEYLVKQNRPYNATDLQANLKNKHNLSKSTVTKCLASLAAKSAIVEKEYGKQKIYGPKQAEETGDPAALAALKDETEEFRARTKELTSQYRELTAQMAALESAPATADLPSQISAASATLASTSAHLASLRSDPSMLLSKADITAIDSSYASVRKIWLERRKMGIELGEMVTEPLGLSKQAAREWLVEEQGIEFDGEALDALAKPQMVVRKPVKRKAE